MVEKMMILTSTLGLQACTYSDILSLVCAHTRANGKGRESVEKNWYRAGKTHLDIG